MIRAAVVEDDLWARRYLVHLLTRTGKVEVVAEAADGAEALAKCRGAELDAAFLDVCLPGASGLTVAAELDRAGRAPLVVFVTGFPEYALQAFDVHAAAYLLKPVEPARLEETVLHLEGRLRTERRAPESAGDAVFGDHVLLRDREQDIERPVRPSEIVAVVRKGRRTWIHTADAQYPTYYCLARLESWLGPEAFIRASRNCIVNLSAVSRIVHYGDRLYQLYVRDRPGTIVRVSRANARELARRLKSTL